MSQHTALLLYFAACGDGPDGCELIIAVGVVVIVQVDGCVDVAGDEGDAVTYGEVDWRAFVPGQDAVFVATGTVFDAGEVFSFGHAAVDGKGFEACVYDHSIGGWFADDG